MKIVDATVHRIKDLCLIYDISYNSLANLSGMPPSTLKNILNGNSKNPGIKTIKILCDGLGISIQEFYNSEVFSELEQEIGL